MNKFYYFFIFSHAIFGCTHGLFDSFGFSLFTQVKLIDTDCFVELGLHINSEKVALSCTTVP